MPFILDQRLDNDTIEIGHLPLSTVRLMNNQRFPWLILVPRIANISELFELSTENQQQLIAEISLVSQRMKAHLLADKINVEMLGNKVSQLHIHIIARFQNDPAWPMPIWGQELVPYSPEKLQKMLKELRFLVE